MLALGIIIRVLLSPFFAHPFDMFSFYTVGERAMSNLGSLGSYLRPYDYSYFIFLFPMTAVFASISHYVGSYSIAMSSLNPQLNPGAQWGITTIPGPIFDFLVKVPLMLSDVLIALIIYSLAKKASGDEGFAASASALWFLNPLVIWVSSAWGTFDALPALFTIGALYLATEKRFVYAGVALSLAVAMKYYAIVLVVPLLYLAWKDSGRKGLLQSGISVAISLLVLFAPLFAETGTAFTQLASGPALSSSYYSGISIWTVVTLFSSTSIATISSIAVAMSLLAVYYVTLTRIRVKSFIPVVSSFALPLLALLLFYSFVGENFLVWLMPFVAILAARNKGTKRLYWALSLVGLISAITDSLLPYYLLPVAPWIGGFLIRLLDLAGPYRVGASGTVGTGMTIGKLFLSGLSIVSFAILILLLAEIIQTRGTLERVEIHALHASNEPV
jgi:hypothetical protein